jgi:DNA-binding response OmpR family regulator
MTDIAAHTISKKVCMNQEPPFATTDPLKLTQPAILLIEDDQRLGQITKELLDDNYRVRWVIDGREAQRDLEAHQVDAIIVDRRLPDMDGLDLVRGLRARGIGTPVLILTALSTTEDIVEGLDGGANDYLTKPFRFEELDARLRVLLRGRHVHRHSYAIGDWMLFETIETIEDPEGNRISLTAAETTLLSVMCDNPAHVFSRDELLNAAFRPDAGGNTIDTYVSYIRQKTTRDLILTIRGRGYTLGRPGDDRL